MPTKTVRSQKQHPIDVAIITEQRHLNDACARIAKDDIFAFDTEFVMEDRFEPDICLVQLATRDNQVLIIDPHTVKDLGPLWKLVCNPELVTVVHAGMEDLALCFNRSGDVPRNVFDCQLANGLVSTDYPLSLSRLVRNLARVRLHKSQTLTDWNRRPLTTDQIEYAAADVQYLLAVHDKIKKRLVKMDRISWLEEEMSRFSEPATYQRAPNETAMRLKGSGSLDARGLAIARELVQVRSKLAHRLNRPVRAVVRDHLLVEIAKHAWTKPDQIKKLRGLSLRNDALVELTRGVQRALDLPRDQWPEVVAAAEESDQEAAISLLVSAVIRSHCAKNRIAHQLVASRQAVRELVCGLMRDGGPPDASPLSSGWRAESVGRIIERLFSGQSAIRIRRNADQTSLCVDDQ